MTTRQLVRYGLLGILAVIFVVGFIKGPRLWQQWHNSQIVSGGERITAVVQAVEPADEGNPSGSRWRYTLLVQPPAASPYRATTEIEGFLVPGDTVVNVAVDPQDPQAVVIIP